MRPTDNKGSYALFGATALLMIASFVLIALAPEDRELGAVQKIFYVHVPAAWTASLAFLINFIGSLIYLARRDTSWDRRAYSSAEIGLLFGAVAIATGSIWARFAWGVWWTWDVRLTATLIMCLTYAGYLLVRSLAEGERRRVLGGVIGVAAFANVPLVFLTVRWWRSVHPVVVTQKGINLDPMMKLAFFASLGAMTLFYICLLKVRVEAGELEERIKASKGGWQT